MQDRTPLFQRPLWVAIFAATAAIVWGWAYPLIKIGFSEFKITADMTASKMLFAGLRFFLSGAIILAVARLRHLPFRVTPPKGQRHLPTYAFLLLYTLLNTTFHYAFFYFGLSHSPGARAAILNSLSVFSVVILACLFFKSDRMTTRKVLGCIVGFSGILALNLDSNTTHPTESFTLLGDGMIIANALCSAFASLMTRGVAKRINVFVGTGMSLGLGGALLVVPGLLMGGSLPHITFYGIVLLVLLIAISTIGFTLYNKLLTLNPVGKVAIYNSLIPVVGAVTSCLCLAEPFYWKYLVAALLATAGIYLINKR
ncbi:MAG: DMT family transporter [Bacteroidales bacterium]|nr:DMT family transporter [Candidatus Physcousia equi]